MTPQQQPEDGKILGIQNLQSGKIMFSKDVLRAEVELPNRNSRFLGFMDLFAREPVFRKWWQFWKPTYRDYPLRVTKLL